jgi:hypothetical protein
MRLPEGSGKHRAAGLLHWGQCSGRLPERGRASGGLGKLSNGMPLPSQSFCVMLWFPNNDVKEEGEQEKKKTGCQWLTLVFLATWEAEIGRIEV